MKRSRYREEQIAYALRQAESGTAVADVCRQLGISEATFYVWKKKVCRAGFDGAARAAAVAGRELEVEAAGGGSDAGQAHSRRDRPKKNLRPAWRSFGRAPPSSASVP